MARAKSGGGISMSKNVKVSVHGGSRTTNVVSPGGVSEYGTALGSKLNRTGSYTSQSYAKPMIEANKPLPVAFGNAKATDVGKSGPGTGRTIHRTGTQMMHGQPIGAPVQGRDIFSQYPPETSSQASLVRKR
jgi:hypothetical protein